MSRPDPSDDHCHREVTTVAESSRSVRGSEDHSVHGLALKTESSLAGRTSCRHCPCPHCWLRTGRCRGDARAPRDLTSPAKNNATLGSQPSAAPGTAAHLPYGPARCVLLSSSPGGPLPSRGCPWQQSLCPDL